MNKNLSLISTIALSLVFVSLPTLAQVGAILMGSGRINVRTQPSIYSPAPQYGLGGDSVLVFRCVPDRDTRGSNLHWCQVQFVRSGAVGWIRSDLLTPGGTDDF